MRPAAVRVSTRRARGPRIASGSSTRPRRTTIDDVGRPPPQRQRRLDGAADEPGRPHPRERAEIDAAVGPGRVDHRQAREPAGGELQVGAGLPAPGPAVEPRPVGVVEPELGDGRLQRVPGRQVLDRHRLPQEAGDLPPPAGDEQRPDPVADVARPADVEDPPVGRPEQVHPGRPGQPGQQRQLPQRQRARRQAEQVVEGQDPVPGGPFEQGVEDLGGGQHVVEGPVGGPDHRAEPGRQRGQPAVGHLVADQAAGQGQGVDPGVGQPGPAPGDEVGVEERRVEAEVVADQHRAADELEQGGEHLVDGRRRDDQRLGDAGQGDDERRQAAARD